jgi:hypothetical protein
MHAMKNVVMYSIIHTLMKQNVNFKKWNDFILVRFYLDLSA